MGRITTKKVVLDARCNTHPRYTAEQKPRGKCRSCWLLYVLRWQLSEKPDAKLGSLNPYTYLLGDLIGDKYLEDACSGIKISKREIKKRA